MDIKRPYINDEIDKMIIEYFYDKEKFIAYLIGVDEVKIEGDTVLCGFLKNSKRYSYYAESIAFIDEFEKSTYSDQLFLIDGIKRLYDSFERIINNANANCSFNNSLKYKYNDETKKIVEKLKKYL